MGSPPPRRYQQLELQALSSGGGGAASGASLHTLEAPLGDALVDPTTLAAPPAIPVYQPSAPAPPGALLVWPALFQLDTRGVASSAGMQMSCL